MNTVHLQYTTGQPEVDAVLRELIYIYEQSFPQQIIAYYIEGSYADQTYLPSSDIDLLIVLHSTYAQQTEQEAQLLWTRKNFYEMDITIIDEANLRGGLRPRVCQLLYGEDVRKRYGTLPIEAWACERMHAAYWLLNRVYSRPEPVQLPLTFPAPTDEFYGYTNRTVELADGQVVPCTRNLVRTTGWAATALLAYKAGCAVERKSDCARLYRERIGDEWSSLLAEIEALCRHTWMYLIPSNLRERQQLRTICQHTLAFEQHFMMIYRTYLLEELRSVEPSAVQIARSFQEQVPLADDEVRTALLYSV